MTLQQDLFSVLLTEKIKTIFLLTPDSLSGSCFYFIKSKKMEFMTGVWLCGTERPGARNSQREKRHTRG